MATNTTVKINYADVKEAVAAMLRCSNRMGQIFDDFNAVIVAATAQDKFDGSAAEAFAAKYADLKTKYDTYTNILKKLAGLTETGSDEREASEKRIQAQAEELSNPNA